MDYIISYNTYRKHAKKYNIKDKTNNGKPVTYNKLKHRVEQFESNKNSKRNKYDEHIPFCQTLEYNELDTLTELPSKKEQPKEIKTLLISYMNDEIDHDELMSNFVKNN